ncbi:GNAT family N-acetyltransferase [Aestuariivirga sp.]|uniref:GNAT family N-acetyltransferase n=1 Tax=Aestuariivirga sp. TaxID=2650926 RepID=UPI00391CE064
MTDHLRERGEVSALPAFSTIRRARRDDARHLARLVDLAGEGLPRYLWSQMAQEGEDVWSVGERRAARDEGSFSWRNAWVAEADGQVAGTLIAYDIGPDPQPLDNLPEMFRPLQALENRVPLTRYINVLACFPQFRRRGIGRQLMETQQEFAGPNGLSIIVADRNQQAIALYRSLGFSEAARLAIVKESWTCESSDWVLLTRPSTAGVAP